MKVRLIKQSGVASLTEYVSPSGGLCRVCIPTSSISAEGEVPLEEQERGIEWGLPWEELLTIRVTPEQIAAELRRHGIWTAEDLRRSPDRALAALQAAYGVTVQTLLAASETTK